MNRLTLSITTLLLLATTTTRSSAQTPTSEEQLQEVVVLGKQKQKTLLRRGARMPGGVAQLTPDQVEHEIGSALTVDDAAEVREITFDIVSNSIKGAVLSIAIYRDSTFTQVLDTPFMVAIPQEKKQTISVVPNDPIRLGRGRYIIAVAFADCDKEVREQWSEPSHWDDKQHYTMLRQSCLQFPLHTKESYIRNGADDTFEKRNLNIGLKVKGCGVH